MTATLPAPTNHTNHLKKEVSLMVLQIQIFPLSFTSLIDWHLVQLVLLDVFTNLVHCNALLIPFTSSRSNFYFRIFYKHIVDMLFCENCTLPPYTSPHHFTTVRHPSEMFWEKVILSNVPPWEIVWSFEEWVAAAGWQTPLLFAQPTSHSALSTTYIFSHRLQLKISFFKGVLDT